MITASINGIPGFGFAKVVTQEDGTSLRTGLLELPTDCIQLESLTEKPMVYSGPVWVGGLWREEAFPIAVTPIGVARGVFALVAFVESVDASPVASKAAAQVAA